MKSKHTNVDLTVALSPCSIPVLVMRRGLFQCQRGEIIAQITDWYNLNHPLVFDCNIISYIEIPQLCGHGFCSGTGVQGKIGKVFE